MPEWLHFVISGSWLGGFWVSARCFVASLTSVGYLVCFWFCSCLFRIDGRCSAWHIRCYREYFLRANSYSLMACFFGCFLVVVCLFLCLVLVLCVALFVVFVPLFCSCFAYEAWEYPLDYVQVCNCPLL